jgi:hypothetical protein
MRGGCDGDSQKENARTGSILRFSFFRRLRQIGAGSHGPRVQPVGCKNSIVMLRRVRIRG